MTEPSAALCDFAIATGSNADLGLVPPLVADLRARYGRPALLAELLGQPQSGEMLLLLRFGSSQYSAALRQKLATEAQHLRGQLIEPALLSDKDKDRFYGEKLAAFAVRCDASADCEAALKAFRAKMGLLSGGPAIELHFESADGVASAWARAVVTGRLHVPGSRVWPAGTRLRLLLSAPGLTPLTAAASVLEPGAEDGRAGLWVLVAPGDEALERFLARQHAKERAGRAREPRGTRAHGRHEVCLELCFEACATLREEYATNIGRGGLFVRTEDPPPLRTKVRLRLKLPDGAAVETEAEVVHLIGVAEARARRMQPGVGLAFATGETLFQRAIEQFLASAVPRKPRILVADDDRLLREVLKDALGEAGCEVDLAADGAEVLEKIAARLYELDLIVIDLVMPGLDGFCLIERMRRLGGEAGLKIVVLSSSGQLEAPSVADEVIAKGMATEEIVARILRLLER